ncbi:MAG: formylglycine-generating enzyme family protein [Pseudomonadales bacterium]|nr:formylglycine-generating enzyme family protein [Pseudomonadales bacterium]
MSEEKQSEQPKVPGRTIGFSIMTVATLFVAIFLYQNSSPDNQSAGGESIAEFANLDGFSSAHWFLPDDNMLGFVEIPAGRFTMGSNPNLDRMAYQNERWSDLRRQGEVELPRYYIARFETTVAQFAAFVADSGAAAPQVPLSGAGNLPVTNVTWPEALAYTRWLDLQLRQSADTPAPLRALLDGGARVTLPNEAEWEKAARGSDGRIFPWREARAEEVANFNSQSTRPVDSSPCTQCAWGLSDMAGNVWELTRSPLQDYPYTAEDDAEGLAEDALYVMRGGSFADGLNNIRAAVRGGVDPGVRNSTIGFRVVVSTQ